jgi:hypothetical protein
MEHSGILWGTFLQGTFLGGCGIDRGRSLPLLAIHHRDPQRAWESAESVICLCDEVRVEFRKDAHYEIGTFDRVLHLLGDGTSFHG